MYSCVRVMFILVVTIPQMKTDDIDVNTTDRVVQECINKAKKFEEIEWKYAKGPRDKLEPSVTGPPPTDELLGLIYKRELSQRPFECITNKFGSISERKLKLSSVYNNLVEDCKSKQHHITCNSSYPYRVTDGACNNLNNVLWGSVMNCSPRLYPANYEGASGIRKSVVGGKDLPNARYISLNLFKDLDKPLRRLSVLGLLFSQLISQDVADNTFFYLNRSEIECCKNPKGLGPHPNCAPIFVNDSFYTQHNVKCLNFYRSAICSTCTVGKRTFPNQVTSYIDCSFVYGYGFEDYRAHDGTGKMEFQRTEKGGDLPPPMVEFGDFCGDPEKKQYCVKCGDRRCNEHATLTMMQTLFFRNHNRICNKLKELNPDWDDETLFQEARKINNAQMQVIVYKEFLPFFLGEELIARHDLKIGTRTTYNPHCDASISVEFSVAFRVHSLIPGQILFDGEGASKSPNLRDTFENIVPLYEGKIPSYLKQMSCHYTQKYDRYMTTDIKNYLNKSRRGKWGNDLLALDIQRSRDNGSPTHAEVIYYISGGTRNISSFDDLHGYLTPDCVKAMKEIYEDVRDIDLFAGMNCELVHGDMLVGPTAGEIIGIQFKKLRDCDRFFFSHEGNFPDDQRNELMKSSLAEVICQNSEVEYIHPEAMRVPHEDSCRFISRLSTDHNDQVPCSGIPTVDLNMWKE